MELGLVFQALSLVASIVSAFNAALSIGETLTRTDVQKIANDAQQHSQAVYEQAILAAQKIKGVSDEMAESIRKRIEQAQKEWQDKIASGSSQPVWAQATDKLKSDCCALLRQVKQLNGGMLPDDWYAMWSDMQCA